MHGKHLMSNIIEWKTSLLDNSHHKGGLGQFQTAEKFARLSRCSRF
jgi:hypothetical protein